MTPLFLTPGRIVAADSIGLRLAPEHLARHIFIGGGSGNGKSKLIELLCRQLADRGCGFTYVDPHGDGVEAVAQYLTVKKTDPARVHYLRPGLDRTFCFDPFAHRPRGVSRQKEDAWLITTVERTVDAFLRNLPMESQEVMKRLKRWLGNVLYACGVEVDGRHLGIADALLLTNPQHPLFNSVLDRIRPRLRPEVAADYEKLRNTKGASQQEAWVESTINCLREILSPATEQMFSQAAPSIDLRSAILNRGIQLINLRKSDEFSRRQRSVMGGLLINFLVDAAENLGDELPLEERVPHYLIIDEAENFIGEDLRMGFAELRKFGLSVCVAVQDLSCLRKGDLDLVSKVVSQCGLQMTFQQQNPDDVEYLAKSFGYGSMDLTPLIVEQALPDGYELLPTVSLNIGESQNQTTSRSDTVNSGHSESVSRSTAESIQQSLSEALSNGWSESENRSHTDSTTESEGEGFSWGSNSSRARGRNWSDTEGGSEGTNRSVARGKSVGRVESGAPDGDQETKRKAKTVTDSVTITEGVNSGSMWASSRGGSETVTVGQQEGGSRTATRGTGSADMRGSSSGLNGSKTVTNGTSIGKTATDTTGAAKSTSRGHTNGVADGRGTNIGVILSHTPIAKHRLVRRRDGFVVPVEEQLQILMNSLASLPDRNVLVKCKGMGMPFILRVHDVVDPYEQRKMIRSLRWKAAELDAFLGALHGAHPYCHTPRGESESDRLRRFLSPVTEADAVTYVVEANPFDDE